MCSKNTVSCARGTSPYWLCLLDGWRAPGELYRMSWLVITLAIGGSFGLALLVLLGMALRQSWIEGGLVEMPVGETIYDDAPPPSERYAPPRPLD